MNLRYYEKNEKGYCCERKENDIVLDAYLCDGGTGIFYACCNEQCGTTNFAHEIRFAA